MSDGWIILHRRLMKKGYYTDSHYVHLWVHILYKANHEEKEFMFNGKIEKCKRGSFITGISKLSRETGINYSKVQRILKLLENEQQIDRQTNNKFSVITVRNYDSYQSQLDRLNDKPVIDKRYSSDRPVIATKQLKQLETIKTTQGQKKEFLKTKQELMKWLEKFDDVTNSENYTDWLYKKYGDAVIEITWKKAKTGSIVNSKGDFTKLCEFYLKKNKDDEHKKDTKTIQFAKSADDDF